MEKRLRIKKLCVIVMILLLLPWTNFVTYKPQYVKSEMVPNTKESMVDVVEVSGEDKNLKKDSNQLQIQEQRVELEDSESVKVCNDSIVGQSDECGCTVTIPKNYAKQGESYQELLGPNDAQKTYYNKLLDSIGKKVYQEVETAIISQIGELTESSDNQFVFTYQNKLEQNELNNTSLDNIVTSLWADHPEWYWLKAEKVTFYNDCIVFPISADVNTLEKRKAIEKKILEQIDSFEQTILEEDSNYEKVRKIHDWVISKAYYVSGAKNEFNIRGILLDGKAVCDSYTRTSQLLFNYFEIPNLYVTGNKKGDSIGHAWNQVDVGTKDKPCWVNYDATWDDVNDNIKNEEDYPEYEGIAYKYFCRSDAQFGHTTAYKGEYTLNNSKLVNKCTEDNYNYFKQNGQFYLKTNSGTEIDQLMASIVEGIHKKEILAKEGQYIVRLGYDASLDINSIMKFLTKDSYKCQQIKGKVEGDIFLYFEDRREYRIVNASATDCKLYISEQNYYKSRVWEKDTEYGVPLSYNTFYIKAESGATVEEVTYQKNSETKQYLNLPKYLKLVDEEKALYLCTLPDDILEEDSKILIEVSCTKEATLYMGFEEEKYQGEYGKKILLTLNVSGTKSEVPNGRFKVYYDKISPETEITRMNNISINNDEIKFDINNSVRDLEVGIHTIYAVYQGDSTYQQGQKASTEIAVSKATLLYTVDSINVEYGEEIKLTGSYDGFVYEDDEETITKEPTLETTAKVGSTPKSYEIKVKEKGEAKNYDIKVEVNSAKVTIVKATPKIVASVSQETPVVGETITFTAQILSSKNAEFVGRAKTYLYQGENKVGEFLEKDGTYTYEYKVENNSAQNLVFTVRTVENETYLANQSEEIHVTADWNYFYVFFNNGGKGEPVESQIVALHGKVTKPEDPTDSKKEQVFVGWYKDVSKTVLWDFEQDEVTQSMTLYGQWKIQQKTNITDIVIHPYSQKAYDGLEHDAATLEGIHEGDIITYKLDGVTWNKMPKIKNVKANYKLTVHVKRDWCNDYEETVVLSILPVVPEIDVSGGTITKDYTGESVNISNDISVNGPNDEVVSKSSITYVYYLDEERSQKTNRANGAKSVGGAPSQSGTYYVSIEFIASGNYLGTSTEAKVIIQPTTECKVESVSLPVVSEQKASYSYQLKEMLPKNKDFGSTTFSIDSVEDSNSILKEKRIDEDGVLYYEINESAQENDKAIIVIRINSQNYASTTAKIVIQAKSKTKVKIDGIDTPNRVYDGKPYQYQGTYEVKVVATGKKLNIELVERYVGTTKEGKAYDKKEAPTEAGQYELTLSVSTDNQTYAGSVTYPFTIQQKELKVKAKDIAIGIGYDVPTYEANVEGLVGNDQLTGLTFACDYVKDDPVNGIVKSYDIVVSGGTIPNSWNYDVKYEKGTLSVKTKRTLSFKIGIEGTDNPASITTFEGDAVTMPALSVEREGFVFAGWEYAKKVYAAYEQFTMIDADIVMTAKWERKIQLKDISVTYLGKEIEVGGEVTKADFIVKVIYSDGKEEETQNYTLTDTKIAKEGDNVVTITYLSYKRNVIIKGVINRVKSITASYRGTVLVGAKMNLDQLTVEATYEDGTTQTITTGYEISSYVITVGKNRITVTYEGKSTTFDVTGEIAQGQAVLTFDSQGGSSVNRAVVDVGKTYQPPTPSRSGYTFKGWFTSTNGGGTQFTGSTIVDSSKILYAYWVQNVSRGTYRIYSSFYGELIAGPLKKSDFRVTAQDSLGIKSMVDDFTFTPNELKVGVNYIMVTYNHVSVLLTLIVPDIPQKITASAKKNIYAQGYTLQKSDIEVIATLADGTIKQLEEKEYTLSNLEIKNGVNTVEVTYNGKTDTFEVLGRTSYQISFNSKGGSKVDSIRVMDGNPIGTLPTPKRKNYNFKGWYFDSECKKQCTASNKIKKSLTLYAAWEFDNKYEISNETIQVDVYGQDSLCIPGAKQVDWVSDDIDIASIDRDGIITGVGPGTVTITGYTNDGYELSCLVTVGPVVEKINVTKSKVTVKRGKTYQIKATVSPKKASTKDLTYRSTNSSIAKVSKSGKVTAVSKGTCYIIIESTDVSKVSKKVKITVK